MAGNGVDDMNRVSFLVTEPSRKHVPKGEPGPGLGSHGAAGANRSIEDEPP